MGLETSEDETIFIFHSDRIIPIPKRALAEGGFLTSKSLMGCKSGVGWLPASSFPFLSPDLVVRYFRIRNQGFPDG
jgi:hypothetical protein